MTRKWDRKMLLSGILLLLILIRHKCVATHADDYQSGRSNGVNHPHELSHIHQQQKQHSRTVQQEILFSSLQHKHRHHHADTIHKNNREMHIKLSHSHLNHDWDYRPVTKATTKTPTTLSRKLSSAMPNNLKLSELTYIGFQGGNETSERTIVPIKNWLNAARERNQQWNAYNKRTSAWPYQVHWNSDDTPTSTLKTDHDTRSSRPYYSTHTWYGYPKASVEKKAGIHVADSSKTSHEVLKSKVDYDEDYDYYEDIDENGNKIGYDRMHDDVVGTTLTATVGDISDDRSEEDIISKETFQNAAENDEKLRASYSRYNKDDYDSSEYQKDEPVISNDDPQNRTISLTDEKWNKLGTAAAVARSRQQYLNSPQSKVDAHIQKLKDEGKCRWPHAKVIQLIDASNRFIPHCTILHRCGDDTGCCEDDKKTCVAKRTTSVDLYFYIIPLDNHSKPSIEVRKFENHTECHCISKIRHRRTLRHNAFAIAQNTNTTNQNCRCPSNFYVLREGDQCRCDCFTGNQECFDLKEGTTRFGSEDQKCIVENKCQKPTCEIGQYNKHSGRCPRLRTPTARNTYR